MEGNTMTETNHFAPALEDDDVIHIRRIFEEDIVPKLKRLHARLGTLSCQFAGDPYKSWTLHFKETGSGFEILDFEYDEDAAEMDLDL
jgi:hypothetical protein